MAEKSKFTILDSDLPLTRGVYPGRGGHWNLGILMGIPGEIIREYWGLRPQYWLIGPLRISPQDSLVSLSTPGLFHTLDIYTEPH